MWYLYLKNETVSQELKRQRSKVLKSEHIDFTASLVNKQINSEIKNNFRALESKFF